MGWPAGGAASEDGGRGWGHRGRRRRLRLRSFIFFILLLAEISTAVDAAAESDGYDDFGNSNLLSHTSGDHTQSHSPPVILEHPSDLIVAEGEPITLNCHSAGNPTPMVRWHTRRDGGRPVVTTTERANSQRIQLPDGSLFFLNARVDVDAGVYYCVASNEYGSVRSRNATLEIAYLDHAFPSDARPPYMNSGDISGVLGSNLELPCTPPRGKPAPVVRWKKDGSPLDLASSKRTGIDSRGHLRIRGLRGGDEGNYSCIASNMAGARESRSVALVVLKPPVITAAPKNSTILVGSDVLLSCAADGEPMPMVSWTFDGKRLDPSRSETIAGKGLRLRRIRPSQSGVYVCTARNAVGRTASRAEVYVQVPPMISRPPAASVVVEGGAEAKLDCEARGRPQPLVVWMHEEERTFLLPGDTAGNLEVTSDAALLVTSPEVDMQLVCFAVNYVGSAMAKTRLKTSSASEIGVTGEGFAGGRRDPLTGGARITSATGVTPTSIRVSWRLTHPLEDMANVDGFYVLYRQADLAEEVGFTSLTVLHAAATSYVVNRLLPYTKYEFVVIPFQRGSPGAASALVEAYTMAVRPIGVPAEVEWRQVNESSIEIRWKQVKEDEFRGPPFGYRILILRHGQLASNVSVEFPVHTKMMSNLEPHHLYHLQIAAINSQGLIGPFSTILQVRPQPSLAPDEDGEGGDFRGFGVETSANVSQQDYDDASSVSWLIPLVVVFAIVAGICAGLVVYSRRNKVHRMDRDGGGLHPHKHTFPSFSSGLFPPASMGSSRAGKHNRQRKSRDFRQRAMPMSSSETMRYSNQSDPLTKSTNRSEGATEDESSDYAYIDRSTHSITGYLNSESKQTTAAAVGVDTAAGHNGVIPHDLVMRQINMSPYATTEIVKMHRKGSKGGDQSKGLGGRPGSRLLPLNVQSYLVSGGGGRPNSSSGGRLAPSTSSLHASSDHIYALVATPTPDPDSGKGAKCQIVQLRPISGAESEGNGILEDHDKTTPNLLDMIPPPPHYPPPRLTTASPPLEERVVQSTPDVTDLYSKVNKGGSGKSAATASGAGTNSAKRKRMRKHSSVSAKNNNNNNNEASAAVTAVDWKSLDDADSSSSPSSDENGDAAGVTAELGPDRPDVVQQCNGGISPTNASAAIVVGAGGGGVSAAEKKRREKSLPRRKTRGQRDQERNNKKKQTLLTPTKAARVNVEVNLNNNVSQVTQERACEAALLSKPGVPAAAEVNPDLEEETTLLLSSTKAVKEAVWQHERQKERQRMKQDY